MQVRENRTVRPPNSRVAEHSHVRLECCLAAIRREGRKAQRRVASCGDGVRILEKSKCTRPMRRLTRPPSRYFALVRSAELLGMARPTCQESSMSRVICPEIEARLLGTPQITSPARFVATSGKARGAPIGAGNVTRAINV